MDKFRLVGVGLGLLSVALTLGRRVAEGGALPPAPELIGQLAGAMVAGYLLGFIASSFARRSSRRG
ncbi:MAG: hypothetical protein WC829_02065 [Hyphomicrobium sp.]|jgi:hypothetical protein